MIELYSAATPNGHKVHIMLGECGLEARYHRVDLDQIERPAELMKLSPLGKIPALFDTDAPNGPVAMFESNAILLYLSQKAGYRLAQGDVAASQAELPWLFFQAASVGPILGQLRYFRKRAPPGNEHALQRFRVEAQRILGALERRLQDSPYLSGDAFGLPDIATYPWVRLLEPADIELPASGALRRWADVVATRPSVTKAYREYL